MTDMLASLETKRDGYEKEVALHRLYLDAYSGMGGFSGSIRQPNTDFWGAGANIYQAADWDRDITKNTYLDKFPRESDAKFRTRALAAHYSNYIKPLTDLKVSYILRKEFTVDGRPPRIDDWRNNVDGRGTRWEQVLPNLALRAATLGYIPVVIDMPPAPRNPDGTPVILSRAMADQLGLRPTVVPLYPANLIHYQCDDTGLFQWANIRTDHVFQNSPFEEPVEITRYTVWYPDSFSVYEVTASTGTSTPSVRAVVENQPHSFGRVPVLILKHNPAPDDPVKGIAMHGQESIEARAHFNRLSELEEHLRSQVFSILVLAAEQNESGDDVTLGTDNGLYLDPMASQSHYFLQPDASVADTYEKRLETTVEEIYRMARAEFARPTQGRAAISGVARKFEFAQTDRALADFAAHIARFEEEVDELVGRALGIGEDALENITVTPPRSFDVEDLQTDLELAVMGINDLRVGPTASIKIRERVIRSMLPNLTDDEATEIAADLEELEKELAQERAAMQAVVDAENDGDESDDEGGTESEGEGPPRNRAQQPQT